MLGLDLLLGFGLLLGVGLLLGLPLGKGQSREAGRAGASGSLAPPDLMESWSTFGVLPTGQRYLPGIGCLGVANATRFGWLSSDRFRFGKVRRLCVTMLHVLRFPFRLKSLHGLATPASTLSLDSLPFQLLDDHFQAHRFSG